MKIFQQSITGPARNVTREVFPAPTGAQLELGEPGKPTIKDQAFRPEVDKNQVDLFATA